MKCIKKIWQNKKKKIKGIVTNKMDNEPFIASLLWWFKRACLSSGYEKFMYDAKKEKSRKHENFFLIATDNALTNFLFYIPYQMIFYCILIKINLTILLSVAPNAFYIFEKSSQGFSIKKNANPILDFRPHLINNVGIEFKFTAHI